jgi:hypothetical protein
MTEQETKTEEVKEPIIGKFKTKRKFLNFVSAVNGAKIRFIRDIAFLKGDKLSGMLEGVVFKITICDENTINFEEVDTNQCDDDMIKRLIIDIEERDVTGYAQKFVISNLQFSDIDDKLCYLEVEEKKPIDKLKALFDKPEVSEKGLSILDQLFGSDEDETLSETLFKSETDEELKRELEGESDEEIKSESLSYMEESFRKMNEGKIIELKSRIEEKTKEVITCKREISQSEKKLKESSEALGILETRLETMTPGDEPNGYVFYVSEEQKNELGLDESTKHIADKIADLLNLKKDVLFEQLTGGFYKIHISKKEDISAEKVDVTPEILEKMSFDPMGKMRMSESEKGEFEYRGDLTWHQLVSKMLRNGFEQYPDFDKLCQSNSYESKEEVKEKHECADSCSHK